MPERLYFFFFFSFGLLLPLPLSPLEAVLLAAGALPLLSAESSLLPVDGFTLAPAGVSEEPELKPGPAPLSAPACGGASAGAGGVEPEIRSGGSLG